ncbi:MAG: ABC transporter substrate-binding protein [Azospirillum sp.]|nr:ABC transporter substrate-binding protein [Azospirillum sp.]
MVSSLRILSGLVIMVLVLAGCHASDTNERARKAAEGKGDVAIGLIWGDLFDGMFYQGAELAQAEINDKGGVLGRPIRFVRADAAGDDPRSVGLAIARKLARDPEVVAAVGHSAPETAIPASITYEGAGILYINPAVISQSVNQHNFQLVFSTIPDDDQFSREDATFASGLGFHRIAVLNTREDWADTAAKAFIKHAVTLGLTVVTRKSFNHQRENFRDILADLGASQFDAIFLAADERVAAAVVKQSLEMNLEAPFLLADLIDIHKFKKEVGSETPLISVPILFNPFSNRAAVHDFDVRFKEKFGSEPDGWAAQGYDAIQMLAYAMERANSTVPLSVATILRYTLSWRGVTGRYSFDRRGSVYTRVIEFATLKKGKIEYHASEGAVVEYKDDSQ